MDHANGKLDARQKAMVAYYWNTATEIADEWAGVYPELDQEFYSAAAEALCTTALGMRPEQRNLEAVFKSGVTAAMCVVHSAECARVKLMADYAVSLFVEQIRANVGDDEVE